MKILMLVGSLRAHSPTAKLTDSVAGLLPAGVTSKVYAGLGELPHYSQDLDIDQPPARVARPRSPASRWRSSPSARPRAAHSGPARMR
jgi:chromate reductase